MERIPGFVCLSSIALIPGQQSIFDLLDVVKSLPLVWKRPKR
jgi:hypothetical protein